MESIQTNANFLLYWFLILVCGILLFSTLIMRYRARKILKVFKKCMDINKKCVDVNKKLLTENEELIEYFEEHIQIINELTNKIDNKKCCKSKKSCKK